MLYLHADVHVDFADLKSWHLGWQLSACPSSRLAEGGRRPMMFWLALLCLCCLLRFCLGSRSLWGGSCCCCCCPLGSHMGCRMLFQQSAHLHYGLDRELYPMKVLILQTKAQLCLGWMCINTDQEVACSRQAGAVCCLLPQHDPASPQTCNPCFWNAGPTCRNLNSSQVQFLCMAAVRSR